MSVISIRDQGALDLVRSLLERGVSVRIKVTGNSMRPLLKGGETVEVAPLGDCYPRLGDILLICDKQGNPIVHRLSRRYYCKNDLYLQTKGDACAYFDKAVPESQVMGCLQRIITDSGVNESAEGRVINLHSPLMLLKARAIVVYSKTIHQLKRRLIFYLRSVFSRCVKVGG